MQSTCLQTLEAAEWQSWERETQSQNWIWHRGPTLSGAACLLFRAYWATGSWCGMRRVKKREEITVRELATRGWALRLENKLVTHRNWEQRICGKPKTGLPADGSVTPLSAADAEKSGSCRERRRAAERKRITRGRSRKDERHLCYWDICAVTVRCVRAFVVVGSSQIRYQSFSMCTYFIQLSPLSSQSLLLVAVKISFPTSFPTSKRSHIVLTLSSYCFYVFIILLSYYLLTVLLDRTGTFLPASTATKECFLGETYCIVGCRRSI